MSKRCNICKSVNHTTRIHSASVSRGMRAAKLVPWNRDKRGVQKAWNKGLTKNSDSRMAQISASLTGVLRPTTSRWNRVHKRGVKQSLEHRRKNSLAVKLARATYAPVWNRGLTKEEHPSLASMALKLVGRPTSGWQRFWYEGKDDRVLMRSRWEVAFAKSLDESNVEWLYEYCTFICGPYSYTPDFYLKLGRYSFFVEIKGYMSESYSKKIQVIRQRYKIPLVVLMQEDLIKIGVLDDVGKVVMPNVCRVA